MNYSKSILGLKENGFSVISDLYSESEIDLISSCINDAVIKNSSSMFTKDLFAIRQLINFIPKLKEYIFTEKMKSLISDIEGVNCFLTKAIYFDKPSESNWFVAYHQDLSISVDRKTPTEGYTKWTNQKEHYGVQPPLQILEDTFTIRIHLDDTNENNGALRVLSRSHLNGIVRIESIDLKTKNEYICSVKKGGVMLMKPLTFHASNKTTNGKQRRVIHLEFNKNKLSAPLKWLEITKLQLSNK